AARPPARRSRLILIDGLVGMLCRPGPLGGRAYRPGQHFHALRTTRFGKFRGKVSNVIAKKIGIAAPEGKGALDLTSKSLILLGHDQPAKKMRRPAREEMADFRIERHHGHRPIIAIERALDR